MTPTACGYEVHYCQILDTVTIDFSGGDKKDRF